MRRTLRSLAGAVLLLSCALGFAEPANADEYETAILDHNVGSTETYRVRARVLGTPGTNRSGGHGYALVELINPTDKPRTVEILLSPNSYGGAAGCTYRRTQRVEAGAKATLDLPLIASTWGVTASFRLDGRPAPETVHMGGGRTGRGGRFAALLVIPGIEAGPWRAYFEGQLKRMGLASRHGVIAPLREPADLPSTWTHLSAFDVVLVDARLDGLTAERQAMLVRYVAGGGHLAVFGLGVQGAGPFADLRRGREVRVGGVSSGFHGLGRWVAVAGAWDATSGELHRWLEEDSKDGLGPLGGIRRTVAGGAAPAFWWPLQIPGLGEVPIKTFFVLILVFVLLVGPLSYIYFRRRRRLPMLLVTIPLFGFVCTAIILGYGLFSEGFGIIGAERSFTVLDQESQEAASTAGRTLYAGLQPSALQPSTDGWIASTAFDADNRSGSSMVRGWHVDLDAGGRLAGSVLPSRTPTPFVSVTVGRSRERLRFRRRADGGFDVLAAASFQPVEAEGAVVLRTEHGAYYVRGAAGALQPVDVAGPPRGEAIQALIQPAATLRLGAGEAITDDYWGGRPRWMSERQMRAATVGTVGLSPWILARLADLPKGAYLARVTRPPLVERFGLDVEMRAQEHVVLGLLGPEDVIDE